MNKKEIFVNAMAILFVCVLSVCANHKMRTYAQDHEWAYEVLTVTDFMDFSMGAASIDLRNQWTWQYATRLNQDRPFWHKIMFWNFYPGFEGGEYPYAPHFEKI